MNNWEERLENEVSTGEIYDCEWNEITDELKQFITKEIAIAYNEGYNKAVKKYAKDIKGDFVSRLECIRIEIINLQSTQEEKYHVWKFEIVKLINELKEDS